MFRRACLRRGSIQFAARVQQIKGVKKVTALITLISSCIRVLTERTSTFDETIRKKSVVLLAIRLRGRPLL